MFTHLRKLFAAAVACALLVALIVRPGTDRGPASHRAESRVAAAFRAARSSDPAAQKPGSRALASGLDVERLPAVDRTPPKRRTVDEDTLVVHHTGNMPDAAYRSAGARRVASIEALDIDVVRTTDRKRTAAALEDVRAIDAVEPNRIRYASAGPNDPGYVDQTHLFLSRFPIAWEVSKGSASLDIAVIDTGVDLDHPDLDSRIVAGYDFVNGDAVAQDDNGHGTMVAGLAGAETNNGIGVSGAAWNARVMPIKVLDAVGAGTDFELAQGIVFAADHGAEVINLSLGGPGSSQILQDAVAYATSKNIVVVAAAGNESTSVPSYPAAIPSVVAVGSTDLDTNASYFTNFGPWVDLAAPGEAMLTTALQVGAEEAYAMGDGTSFAAPVVSGVALLHKARTPSATAAQIAAKLASSAADRGPVGIDDYYGRGLLDAYGAVGGRTAASPPAPTDSHEPNDVPARATEMSGTITSSLQPAGDVDWFSFSAPAAGQLRVQASSPTDPTFTPVLAAYAEDLETLPPVAGVVTSPQAIVVSVDAGGMKLVRVANNGPAGVSPYTLVVTFVPTVIRGFGDYRQYDAGFYAGTIAVGDVTNDGLSDIVVQTSRSAEAAPFDVLYVFKQTMLGTLAPPVVYEMGLLNGYSNQAMSIADIDGDGDNDLVTPTHRGVEVFVQNPRGLDGPQLLASMPDVNEVVVRDLGGDGVPEIVVLDDVAAMILTFNGSAWTTETSVAQPPRHLEVADVTGDGLLDVVGTWYSSVVVLAQRVDGSFGRHEYLGSPLANLDDVAVGDFNHDDRLDVVGVAGGNGPYDVVFQQTPEGTLSARPIRRSPPMFDSPVAVDVADVNRDGHDDVVTLGSGHAGVSYLGRTGLRDMRLYRVPFSSQDARRLAVADVTGDMLPDVITSDLTQELSVLPQAGTVQLLDRLWVRSTTPVEGGTGLVATASPTITFARDITTSSLTAATIKLLDGSSGAAVPASRSYDAATRTVTVDPVNALVAGRAYMLDVNGVKDAEGTMGERHTTRFTVARAPAKPAPAADVNGDGYDDVIVGAPGEDVGTLKDAGVFHVLLGSATGAKTTGNKLYTQDTQDVPGTAEAGDAFGAAIATGDVNADGYDDVAVGAPGEDVGTRVDAGLVHLFLGSATGLRALGSQTWTQDSKDVAGAAEKSDRFGAALVWGAFDGVAGDDLAIGAPGEAIGVVANAGVVYVLSGRSTGLTASGSKSWTEASATGSYGSGSVFGAALAAGDFDGDTHDDLVVGAPGKDRPVVDQGTITLFNGTILGPRPTVTITSAMLTGQVPAAGERFGSALASADFGGLASLDHYDDLAVGAPGAASGEGRVDIVFSDWMGLGLATNTLRQVGNGNQAEAGDAFGASLAAARTKAGMPAWLAVGAPGEDEPGMTDAGVVHVTTPGTGFDGGMLAPPAISQNTGPVQDAAESGDRFGARVSVLDVDKDGWPDVVVGSPGESVGTKAAAGTVHVLRHVDHVTTTMSQQLVQGAGGLAGAAESGDRFGDAVTN